MRIAIITLPLRGNYGGILQNYALQTVLKRMGHTVETIVLPWELHQPCWRKPLSYTKRFIWKFILRKKTRFFYERWYNRSLPILLVNTWNFMSENLRMRKIRDFSEIQKEDYDAFVIGSDQIWRPSYAYKPIEIVFLSFAKNWKNIKRISYAASFGVDTWEYTYAETEQCEALIKLFDAISVREDSGVELCEKYLHCKAVHVLDPTMLLTVNDYISLFENKSLVNPQGQLLTYILDETSEKALIIQKVAEHYHYQPFRSNSRYEDEDAPLEERVQPPVEQWLKDFYDAKFVVTDSFHATVFSILFGKPFIVVANKDRGISRLRSLLDMFNLENHIIYSLSELDLAADYSLNVHSIAMILQSWRVNSMSFLKNKLKD